MIFWKTIGTSVFVLLALTRIGICAQPDVKASVTATQKEGHALKPELLSVQPKVVSPYEEVTLTGTKFRPEAVTIEILDLESKGNDVRRYYVRDAKGSDTKLVFNMPDLNWDSTQISISVANFDSVTPHPVPIYYYNNAVKKALHPNPEPDDSDCACTNSSPFNNFTSLGSKIGNLRACLKKIRRQREAKKHLKDTESVNLKKKMDKQIGCLEQSLLNAARNTCSQLVTPSVPPDPKVAEVQARLNGYISDIKSSVEFSDCSSIITTFSEYDQFLFKLYAGYEFATVSKLFQKGAPRAGLLVMMNYADPVPDHKHGLGLYGLQHFFVAQLTGSGEIDSTQGKQPINIGEGKALEFAMPIFVPVYRTKWKTNDNHLISQYIGPYFEVGGKKVVADDSADKNDRGKAEARYYSGIRFAKNPEAYVDLTTGKTTGLPHARFEAKAQLPIYRFDNNTRLFIGAIGNFGFSRDHTDVTRVYLTWNVDVLDIFGAKSK